MAPKSSKKTLPMRFVHTTKTNPTLDDDNKRVVRSNAMRNFRRRQRGEGISELGEISTASDSAYRKHRQSRLQRQREPRPQPKPSALDEGSPDSSRKSVSSCSSSETDLFNYWCSPPIITLHSPVVYQCSLYSAFFTGTISRHERELPSIKRCFEYWLKPRSSALNAAFQAVLLFEFGSTTHNKSASVEGLKWHLLALQRLRRDLEDPKADHLAIQGTAQMLLFCGNYKVAWQAGRSRMHQIEGLMTLHTLKRAGPGVCDPLERSLFRTLRLLTIMNGLVTRKSLDVRILRGYHGAQGSAEDLVQSALCLPAILEETDKILASSNPKLQDLHELVLRACVLDMDFQRWHVHHISFHRDTECSAMPLQHIERGRGNTRLCTEFEKAFGGAIEFDNFLCANLHCFHWICLLLVRQCMHSLVQTLTVSQTATAAEDSKSVLETAMEKTIKSLGERDLLAETNDCADSLCRTVPYLLSCTDGSCSLAMAVAAPLNFAFHIYSEDQQQDKAACCLEMIQKIQQIVPYLDWDTLGVWHIYAILWLARPNE